jgi:hypothetical protein
MSPVAAIIHTGARPLVDLARRSSRGRGKPQHRNPAETGDNSVGSSLTTQDDIKTCWRGRCLDLLDSLPVGHTERGAPEKAPPEQEQGEAAGRPVPATEGPGLEQSPLPSTGEEQATGATEKGQGLVRIHACTRKS